MDAIAVGIDVPKDRLDVCVRPTGEWLDVGSDAAGIEALVRGSLRCRPRSWRWRRPAASKRSWRRASARRVCLSW